MQTTQKYTDKELQLLHRPSNVYHGQWGPGPIPRLTEFKYWNRVWEVKVSNYPFMGWGLYAVEPARAGDELLPFVGRIYSKAEFTKMETLDPRFIRYVLKAKRDMYVDGDVEYGNVAGYINSSIGRRDICNVLWEYVAGRRPWNTKERGYTMTIARRDICAGEELFTFYPVNL